MLYEYATRCMHVLCTLRISVALSECLNTARLVPVRCEPFDGFIVLKSSQTCRYARTVSSDTALDRTIPDIQAWSVITISLLGHECLCSKVSSYVFKCHPYMLAQRTSGKRIRMVMELAATIDTYARDTAELGTAARTRSHAGLCYAKCFRSQA